MRISWHYCSFYEGTMYLLATHLLMFIGLCRKKTYERLDFWGEFEVETCTHLIHLPF